MFLTSDTDLARLLRRHYVFKCIPMLNPDGVICGNYRCGLAGVDLNRQWGKPSSILHPTVFHFKRFLTELVEKRDVHLFLDLHGHSKREHVFLYGCMNRRSRQETRQRSKLLSAQIMMVPYHLSHLSPASLTAVCVRTPRFSATCDTLHCPWL